MHSRQSVYAQGPAANRHADLTVWRLAFYAANKLGALPALIHPLSTAPEIEHYLSISRARIVLTLDAFYPVFAAVKPQLPLVTLILARIPDALTPIKRLGFRLTKGRHIASVPPDPRVRWRVDLMRTRHPPAPRASAASDDAAAILFSGGTTGIPVHPVVQPQLYCRGQGRRRLRRHKQRKACND